jgi:hypothetical protein
MKTQSDSQHWYVLLEGKRHGPLSYADLTKAARDGVITADTNIWRSGWKNWHLARSVRGLVPERAPIERPVEAPLAPDDNGWADEQVRAPQEEAYQYVPPQHRETRRSQDVATLRYDQRRQPVEDGSDHIFADEWRMLARRPGDGRRAAVPARVARAPDAEFADDDADYRDRQASPFGMFLKRATIGLCAVVLLAGGGVVLLHSGVLRPQSMAGARAALLPSPGDLPAAIAALPAVIALQRNDPEAFEKFKKRFASSAANARDDEIMTVARNALRKSVKHLLAISSGDVLIEITETSLAYLQGLQVANPESCVAFTDETKGARLTSNLARELPSLFGREMSVLEKIASTNPHIAIAPMTTVEARPYFDRVASVLVRQSVKTELQGRERLEPSEFQPYCALVIAFYQAVLDLPRDDKINLLRNLYATAAENEDADLRR